MPPFSYLSSQVLPDMLRVDKVGQSYHKLFSLFDIPFHHQGDNRGHQLHKVYKFRPTYHKFAYNFLLCEVALREQQIPKQKGQSKYL